MKQRMSYNEIINSKIKPQKISKQKQNKYGQVVKGEYEPPWQRVSVEDVYQLISEKGLVVVDCSCHWWNVLGAGHRAESAGRRAKGKGQRAQRKAEPGESFIKEVDYQTCDSAEVILSEV